MRAHRTYTKRQKAVAVIAAEMTTQSAAAKKTKIPLTTLHEWLDKPEFVELRKNAREGLQEEVTIAARMTWRELTKRVAAMEDRELVSLAGVAADKMLLMSGQATSRTETKDITETLTDHEREQLRHVIEQALEEVAVANGD